MNPEELNVIVPAAAAILGALVGGVSSIIPNQVAEHYRRKNEAELIQASLIAEVSALIEIAAERNYLQGIESVISHLQEPGSPEVYIFRVNVPSHYSRIYQAHAHKIGVIKKDIAVDIVRFHQLVDAVIQDVSPGGILYDGGTIIAFQENQQILSRALTLGRHIVSRT